MARPPLTDTETLKTARSRFQMADAADTPQAQRERDDLAFYAGDQWPADLKLARQGQQPINGMPAVPARPTLVINKVREPVRQVQNEIRDLDIGIELTPADDFGDLGITPDDEEVLLREGLLRRTLRDSRAQDAWNWAGDRADIAGRGYFLILAQFLPGKTADQEIVFKRVFNQSQVLGDPARTEPDGSDAGWWFVWTWMPWEDFKAAHPKVVEQEKSVTNPLLTYDDSGFKSLKDLYPTWYSQAREKDGGHKAIRIVDYYYLDKSTRELVTFADGSVAWADEMPEDSTAKEIDRRDVPLNQPMFCKIAGGIVILEETELPGTELPVIETVGEEMQPYDEQRRIEGMVRNARDAQMGENYMISKLVETVGLTPIPALMVDPKAIETFEPWYMLSNTRSLPYLPYRSYDDDNQALAPPHRPPVDPNLQPLAVSIAMFDQFIKSTTAVPDPTLGNVDPTLKSGRAIRETVANAKGSTSNFVSNRVRSMYRGAKVCNAMFFDVYGQRPGRLLRVLTGEGKPDEFTIGDPSQQSQRPQGPQIGGTLGAMAPQQTNRQKAEAKVAKLTKDAQFNIAIKITKNFDTRRQQENSELGELIGREPQLMTWFGDLYVGSSDMPNRKAIAKRAKVMLAPPIQAMIAAEESGEHAIPPQVQQRLAQMEEALKQADVLIQDLHQKVEGKQLDYQAKIETEKMRSEVELRKADLQIQLQQMKDATTLAVEHLKNEQAGILSAHTAVDEAIALDSAHAHDATMATLQQQHDQAMATTQMAHGAATADGQADRAEAEAQRDREMQAEAVTE